MAPLGPGQISVVLICKNEVQSIPKVLGGLLARYGRWIHEILVIDDDSTDGTPEIVTQWMEQSSKVRLIRKGPPSGPGAALKVGLQAVDPSAAWILSMDSDFEQSLPDVQGLIDKAGEGYEGVIGSRFIGGARLTGYPVLKRFANRTFHKIAQGLFGILQEDLTNNFKLYRREVFDSLDLCSNGFAVNAETGLYPIVAGFRIAEAPVRWIQRTGGRSHFHIWKEGAGYARVLWRAWQWRRAHRR